MVSSPGGVTAADEGRLVAEILFRADVDDTAYRIGLSEVSALHNISRNITIVAQTIPHGC